jgi:hypothetical protein
MRGPCRFAQWLRVGIALPVAILGFGKVRMLRSAYAQNTKPSSAAL